MGMNLNGAKIKGGKLSRRFVESYNANEKVIDRKNFREFVIG